MGGLSLGKAKQCSQPVATDPIISSSAVVQILLFMNR